MCPQCVFALKQQKITLVFDTMCKSPQVPLAQIPPHRNGGSTKDPICSLLRAYNAAPWHRGMAVRIANTTDKPVTLTSDTFIGQVIPVKIVSGQEHRSVPISYQSRIVVTIQTVMKFEYEMGIKFESSKRLLSIFLTTKMRR